MKKIVMPAAILAVCMVPGFAVAQDTTTEPTTSAESTYEPNEAELQLARVAIAEVGCTVDSDAIALQVEAFTGFDEYELGIIVEKLRIYQEIVDASDEGGITLVSGDCAL